MTRKPLLGRSRALCLTGVTALLTVLALAVPVAHAGAASYAARSVAISGHGVKRGHAYALALTADRHGGFYVLGGADPSRTVRGEAQLVFVAHVNRRGRLLRGFGNGGVAVRRFEGPDWLPRGEMGVDSRGRIVIAFVRETWTLGDEEEVEEYDMRVMRLDARGRFERGFGRHGVGTFSPVSYGSLSGPDFAVTDDASVYARTANCGNGRDSSGLLCLARMSAEGGIDKSFGEAGVARLGDVGAGVLDSASLESLVAGPKGSLTLAGSNFSSSDETVRSFVGRIGSNGAPIPGFGTAGVAIDRSAPPGAMSIGRAVAAAPGSMSYVVSSGAAKDSAESDWLRVQRIKADGTPDPSYGTAGESKIPFRMGGPTAWTHAASLSDGTLYVAAPRDDKVTLLGFTSAGAPRKRFGGDGRVELGRCGYVAGPVLAHGRLYMACSRIGKKRTRIELIAARS